MSLFALRRKADMGTWLIVLYLSHHTESRRSSRAWNVSRLLELPRLRRSEVQNTSIDDVTISIVMFLVDVFEEVESLSP